MVGWEDHESAPMLVLEDLSAGKWPPPWDERRIELVLAQIRAMHGAKVSLERYAQVHGSRRANWQTVAERPETFLRLGLADARWLENALPLLLREEARCSVDGDSLTHWDLRSDNMCFAGSRVVFVDWNNACLSNPQLDIGFWLPSLAHEGGPKPERILPDAPEVAARVSGFFAALAGLPPVRDAPKVRVVQRQQLVTALAWVVRALELPPPGN